MAFQATDENNGQTSMDSGKPFIQIKKWNNVAIWTWDLHQDMCAICRADVMEACLVCQSENKCSECVIVWGKCNHAFHNCCIVKWVEQSRYARCPLCQQEWIELKKHQLD